MRYGTVCSGVEAFGPAWKAMGYESVFHAEIAPHPSAVLRYHYPDVPNYGDFTTIHSERIDLLAGGTPCQDFSVAGLRKGLAGKRGNLTLEFARLAERLRPRWLVWENVPGVLSADGGRAFGAFLTLLAECGYYAAYRVLDAQHFGVPQRRRRVFLVAYLGDWRPAAAVLFESESLRRHPAPRRETREEAPGGLKRGIEFGGGVAGTMTATVSGHGPASRNEMAATGYLQVVTAEGSTGLPSLTASNIGRQANNQQPLCITGTRTHALTAEGFDASEDGTGRGTPIVAQGYTIHGTPATEVASWSDTAQCLRARAPGTIENSSTTVALCGPGVRRLTPLECERVMGYPDNWTQFGVKPNGTTYEVADGPRYQMCGNGWAPDVANWVAGRVKMVDALLLPS